MSIEPGIPSNHLILCHPLLLLPSTFPSIRVFSNELAFHIRWAEYMSFCFSINPSNEYSALIPFRIDWFDLLDQICTYTWFTLLYSRNNIIKQVYSNKVDLKKKNKITVELIYLSNHSQDSTIGSFWIDSQWFPTFGVFAICIIPSPWV